MELKKSFQLKKLLIALALIVFLALFSWLSYRIAFKLAGRLPETTKNQLLQTQFALKADLNNLIDIFYPKSFLQKIRTQELETINLLISGNDLAKINQDVNQSMTLGYNDKQSAGKQPINLIFKQQEIPAKISFHGGGANNFIFAKTDYDLDLAKDQSINDFNRFALFNPAIHHWLAPFFANQIAEKLNLFANHKDTILLQINHQPKGVYVLEEKIDDKFLTRRNLTGAVIKLKDETRLPHRINTVALNAHHLSGLDFSIANVDQDPPDERIMYQVYQLFNAIKSKDFTQIAKFFDLDYLARYEAYRQLFGIDHDSAGDNQIFIFLTTTQKFYPIVRSEGDLNKLEIIGGTSLKSYNRYDPHLADQYDYPRLFLLLYRLPEFRQLTYQYLNQLVNQEQAIKNQFNQASRNLGEVFVYDTTDEASVSEKQQIIKNQLAILDHNFSLIKNQLNFASVAISVINQSGSTAIEIIPDSIMPIAFTKISLTTEGDKEPLDITDQINKQTIMAAFSDDYDLLPTTFSFSIPNIGKVTKLEAHAYNVITGEEVTAVHVGIATP